MFPMQLYFATVMLRIWIFLAFVLLPLAIGLQFEFAIILLGQN